jgi:hypothetical protein
LEAVNKLRVIAYSLTRRDSRSSPRHYGFSSLHRLPVFALVICPAIFILGACSPDKSTEALFQETLAAMEQAMENRDVGEFMEYVSDGYQDPLGRSWDDIRRIAQLHVLRNRNLHIYRHVAQLTIVDEQYANIVIFVALAGQPIGSAESLANMRAELMRFEVSFQFNEKWQAVSAQWKRAGISDFL